MKMANGEWSRRMANSEWRIEQALLRPAFPYSLLAIRYSP